MVAALRRIGYFKQSEPQVFAMLSAMVRAAQMQTTNGSTSSPSRAKSKDNKQAATILFSPRAASFEKFKNEFDRGRKFSAYSKRYFLNKKIKKG